MASPDCSPLLADLYQLTMLQAYWQQGMAGTATFEMFSRRLPDTRNFLLAAGLESLLDWLEDLHFTHDEIDWLAGTGRFSEVFLRTLRDFRFTGDVWAMPEGTLAFADEPFLRVTAPLREAQFIESRALNLLHFQTVVASKAARCVLAAPGKQLVDFGMRRSHGAEAGLLSARASYLAGFDGTATLLAGMRFAIPLFGTMAHSFVQAHDNEMDAFERFVRAQPANSILLIDTYDTEAAARKVVALQARLRAEGLSIRGVRIDSGDLGEHARRVRAILDAGGMQGTTILASGNLDEWRLDALVRQEAPIDGFGVGTRMNTAADAPFLDCAYKLVSYDGAPRRKRSEGKATWPGVKQVYRHFAHSGSIELDTLALDGEPQQGVPLLEQVMAAGKRTSACRRLHEARRHAREQVSALSPVLRALHPTSRMPVVVAPRLRALAASMNGG
ncbi:nicotinate phosphoribosyltransferase [Variovorax sp. HW608]|uniref:nicotinate phosphoribosyltransferase n=1 Tax=Variovorax sp. HW608 TaxID=1034889 RepID=UPI0022B26AB3|nr:nicotinate phosphoribosyltransferase [Variovorax sp. HW608]